MKKLELRVKKLEPKKNKQTVCTNTSPLITITCCDMGDLWEILASYVDSYCFGQ